MGPKMVLEIPLKQETKLQGIVWEEFFPEKLEKQMTQWQDFGNRLT